MFSFRWFSDWMQMGSLLIGLFFPHIKLFCTLIQTKFLNLISYSTFLFLRILCFHKRENLMKYTKTIYLNISITRNATRCKNHEELLHNALLWKFQYFRRHTNNSVKHLWRSFYCENNKPLNILTKKLHRRCSLGF